MKLFRHLIILVSILFSCLSGSARAEDAPRAPKREMKGMELYSWRDDTTRQWIFSLLVGTNALKTAARIMEAQNAIKTLEELKARLGALAVGEYVSWNSHADPKVFSLPPQDVVQEVMAFSESKQLNLNAESK